MIKFRIDIQGTAPLLMHSSRLANPLDPATKALKGATSKRTKTDDDHEEVSRLEHAGSLYIDSELGPYMPAENISRSLVDGAKLSKRGVKVTRGVFVETDVNELIYRGPRDVDGLWKDVNFRHIASVKVGTSRVMRCRPHFKEWQLSATGILDPNILDLSELADIATTAGQVIGLGDWRPRFGRYVADVTEISS